MVTVLGIINLYLREYDRALNLLEVATGFDSENLMAYYFLGQCYEAIGVSELSMEYYDKILLQNIPYESDFFLFTIYQLGINLTKY